jgi:hypothetical protein
VRIASENAAAISMIWAEHEKNFMPAHLSSTLLSSNEERAGKFAWLEDQNLQNSSK